MPCFASSAAATINQALADNADTDLLEIEAAFREAAAKNDPVADGAGFRIVIGVQAWVAELGRMPEQNRQALADVCLRCEQQDVHRATVRISVAAASAYVQSYRDITAR